MTTMMINKEGNRNNKYSYETAKGAQGSPKKSFNFQFLTWYCFTDQSFLGEVHLTLEKEEKVYRHFIERIRGFFPGQDALHRFDEPLSLLFYVVAIADHAASALPIVEALDRAPRSRLSRCETIHHRSWLSSLHAHVLLLFCAQLIILYGKAL